MSTPQPFSPGFRLTDGNTLNNRLANPVWSVSETFTATVGGTVSTSAKIANTITNVTTANAASAGVTVPQAQPGSVLIVTNNTSNLIVVFADGDSTINGVPGNVGYGLNPTEVMLMYAVAPKTYTVTLLTVTTNSPALQPFLANPTSANLRAAVADATGTGALVFATSPTLITPQLKGSSTGYSTFASANNGASNYTVTFPAETMTVGFRNIPKVSKTSNYVLTADEVGKYVSITTGDVTVNASVFSPGDVVSIYNNSAATQQIVQGAGVTLRLAGTATTGTRTIAAYGVATLLCDVGAGSPVFAVSGNVT